MRRTLTPRKLLVAGIGVAAISYGSACSHESVLVGNPMIEAASPPIVDATDEDVAVGGGADAHDAATE